MNNSFNLKSFIENPTREFYVSEFPPIREQFSLDEIKTCVLNLYMVLKFFFSKTQKSYLIFLFLFDQLSKSLRAKRFENGCLTLNQVKINFVINKECGLPYGYTLNMKIV